MSSIPFSSIDERMSICFNVMELCLLIVEDKADRVKQVRLERFHRRRSDRRSNFRWRRFWWNSWRNTRSSFSFFSSMNIYLLMFVFYSFIKSFRNDSIWNWIRSIKSINCSIVSRWNLSPCFSLRSNVFSFSLTTKRLYWSFAVYSTVMQIWWSVSAMIFLRCWFDRFSSSSFRNSTNFLNEYDSIRPGDHGATWSTRFVLLEILRIEWKCSFSSIDQTNVDLFSFIEI